LVAGFVQATTALWKPFEAEFGSFQNELQRQNEDVREEINLASRQAAHQERQLQVMEREVASQHRVIGTLFRRRAELDSDEARNWRIEASEWKSSRVCLSNKMWMLY
jgi:hypothetical protein